MTTVVQQIDAQGPAIVDRITTQFTDLACTQENARQLVEALHSGAAVTLNANGKTATFTPTAHLGYGEAYIALALAAEALRNAGVTGCATPDQWQAVLMGGPLSAAGTASTSTSTTSSASSTSRFPGILALHSQGQGWGQIAQTTNVQLGQIMSNAHSSLNLSTSGDSTSLSPTGRTSIDSTKSSSSTSPSSTITTPSSTATGKEKDQDKNKDKDDDQDKSPDKSHESTSAASSHATPSASSSATGTSTPPRSNR